MILVKMGENPKGNSERCETREDNSISIFVWMMGSYFSLSLPLSVFLSPLN